MASCRDDDAARFLDAVRRKLREAANPYRGTNRPFDPDRNGDQLAGAVGIYSVHQTKGRDAKHVIVLNASEGAYGFPATNRDQKLLEPVQDVETRVTNCARDRPAKSDRPRSRARPSATSNWTAGVPPRRTQPGRHENWCGYRGRPGGDRSSHRETVDPTRRVGTGRRHRGDRQHGVRHRNAAVRDSPRLAAIALRYGKLHPTDRDIGRPPRVRSSPRSWNRAPTTIRRRKPRACTGEPGTPGDGRSLRLPRQTRGRPSSR